MGDFPGLFSRGVDGSLLIGRHGVPQLLLSGGGIAHLHFVHDPGGHASFDGEGFGDGLQMRQFVNGGAQPDGSAVGVFELDTPFSVVA